MKNQVKIINQKQVFKKFIFEIEEATLQHEKYDGTMSEPITRLNFSRGDGASIILHNVQDDTLIFTEQFRYPAYKKGSGWLLEAVAGTVEADEDISATIRRELLEEVGYEVDSMEHISTFFVSPGGTSERIHLYYATVKPESKVAHNTGLDEEDEDIRTVILPLEIAVQKIVTGEIQDAKTIIGIQWLQLKKLQSKLSNPEIF